MAIIGKGTLYIDGKAVGDIDGFETDKSSEVVMPPFEITLKMDIPQVFDMEVFPYQQSAMGRIETSSPDNELRFVTASALGKTTTVPFDMYLLRQMQLATGIMNAESYTERRNLLSLSNGVYGKLAPTAKMMEAVTEMGKLTVRELQKIIDRQRFEHDVKAWQLKPLTHLNTAITDMTYHVRRALRHWS